MAKEDKTEAEVVQEEDWDTESTGGELYKFENIGDKVTGLLIARKNGKTKLGDADFYTILTKDGEKTFVPTKALGEDLSKFVRMYGIGKVILDVELTALKPGNFASPFKVFKVRAALSTESRLASHGIKMYDAESESEEVNA